MNKIESTILTEIWILEVSFYAAGSGWRHQRQDGGRRQGQAEFMVFWRDLRKPGASPWWKRLFLSLGSAVHVISRYITIVVWCNDINININININIYIYINVYIYIYVGIVSQLVGVYDHGCIRLQPQQRPRASAKPHHHGLDAINPGQKWYHFHRWKRWKRSTMEKVNQATSNWSWFNFSNRAVLSLYPFGMTWGLPRSTSASCESERTGSRGCWRRGCALWKFVDGWRLRMLIPLMKDHSSD